MGAVGVDALDGQKSDIRGEYDGCLDEMCRIVDASGSSRCMCNEFTAVLELSQSRISIMINIRHLTQSTAPSTQTNSSTSIYTLGIKSSTRELQKKMNDLRP